MKKSELDFFEKNGFVGPFSSSLPATYFQQLYERVGNIIDHRETHPLYRRYSVRDWHLIDDYIIDLFTDDEVLIRLKAILGNDLVLWRTKVFDKLPGEKELGWHQEWGRFNGEEIGNDIPALLRPGNSGEFWNLTVWFALVDVTMDMGPIRFAKGTHRKRFPIEMAPIMESEFWHDSYLEHNDAGELIHLAMNNSLVLDIDTASIFDESDIQTLSVKDVKDRIQHSLATKVGAKTLEFCKEEHDVVELPMKAGQFVIFTERTMHGSAGNVSANRRTGINGRIATADTIIYPGRLKQEFIDGSNLDISSHRCILLSGEDRTGKNVF